MNMQALLALLLILQALSPAAVSSEHASKQDEPSPSAVSTAAQLPALDYLLSSANQYRDRCYIYDDFCSPANHFPARAKMSSPGFALADMDENWLEDPASGSSAIRCSFMPQNLGWGGWYFMSGSLSASDNQPQPNWGTVPDAGLDLSGAQSLHFQAKGAEGGERVEFFLGGVGYVAGSTRTVAEYPESSAKISLGYITLDEAWQSYTIDLRPHDLSSVLGGFGWVTNSLENRSETVFYLDDIYIDLPRDPLRLPTSYRDGTDMVALELRNTAYTYDAALSALAFLAADRPEEARSILDALVYAQENDRFFSDGRLRNAYQGGDLVLPPGWQSNGRDATARMPGWQDPASQLWFEDEFNVSSHTGNIAWGMLALLAHDRICEDDRYLDAAVAMGEWIEEHCRDERGAGGYTAGYNGWEGQQQKLLYKSNEHNIDLYAAFLQLYQQTGDTAWQERAEHAYRFIVSMWDEREGCFYTGSGLDGISINKETIPVDVQAWSLLALRERGEPFRSALTYAEGHHRLSEAGYDFDESLDGTWYEGTAQMACAYKLVGDQEQYRQIVELLEAAQNEDGSLEAASIAGLTTGFSLADGSDWLYYRWKHIGATAWALMAQLGVNPFWLE